MVQLFPNLVQDSLVQQENYETRGWVCSIRHQHLFELRLDARDVKYNPPIPL